MTYAALYAATLIVFLALDFVWLKAVALPMFRRHIGALMAEDPKLPVAAGFYAFYVAGIVYFAAAPGLTDGAGAAFLNGLILGFLAYGTYEATNMATLKGWRWSMVLSDVGWGAFLTGVSAALGVMIVGG